MTAQASPGRAAVNADAGPIAPFEIDADLTPQCRIDELVFRKLKHLGIQPARLCSDEVFVRRAFLDTIGTLPTMDEARQFIADRSPTKRHALIGQLVERDEFAEYWAMKWSDLLRVKAEFPINLWPNAVQAYHHWILDRIRRNVPYDRFVRELLTSSGSNFRVPPVNFYRAVQSRDPQMVARTVALTFMGARAERWPKSRLAGMAAFFSQVAYKHTGEWKEEIVFHDPSRKLSGEPLFPDGTHAHLTPDQDPRIAFANWLVSAKNPWFGRSIANRVWAWTMGRGIVHEPDDIRSDNPPTNPELLSYLERELVSGHYDLKHMFRLILNSKTYQLSSIPRSNRPEADGCFAHYRVRRIEAEVLIDALDQITGSTEAYTSPIPEPFTFTPDSARSISLADGSTSSSFLEMFGRPSRDTGLESERSNMPTADQRLHMLNSSHIQRKLERSLKLSAMIRPGTPAKDAIARIYLTILSRNPTDDELKIVQAYSRPGTALPRETAIDLEWALINSAEFLYRH